MHTLHVCTSQNGHHQNVYFHFTNVFYKFPNMITRYKCLYTSIFQCMNFKKVQAYASTSITDMNDCCRHIHTYAHTDMCTGLLEVPQLSSKCDYIRGHSVNEISYWIMSVGQLEEEEKEEKEHHLECTLPLQLIVCIKFSDFKNP